MSQQKLYVGMDMRDDFTQLAVLGTMQTEPDVLTASEETEDIGTETVVAIPGTDERIKGFLEKIERQERFYAGGKECDPVNVLAAFLENIVPDGEKISRRDD